jgi:hypothetical protein
MAKAKGTTLLSLVKFLRSQRETARKQLPHELHHYLDERIQPALWYPEEDLFALIRVMLDLLPVSRKEGLALMGATVAREHLEGIYGHLRLGEMEFETLARNSRVLWASMHDTGTLTARVEKDREASFELSDYGHPSTEMCVVLTAYFAETLRMAGAVAPDVRKLACRLDGMDACRWEAHWQEA